MSRSRPLPFVVSCTAAVLGCMLGPGGAEAARGAPIVETAGQWKQAFNEWEARRGAPDRIVAFVDHSTKDGVRYLEIEASRPGSRGTVETCGWLAVEVLALPDPRLQIVGGGPETCSGLRGEA